MPVKLVSEPPDKTILPRDMRDGQIGVITNSTPYQNGTVVQMMRAGYGIDKDTLITVGQANGKTWDGNLPDFGIRLLEPGETIEVTSN